MRVLGAILMLIGLIAGIAAFCMDTSVQGEHSYDRIVNLGLVAEKIVAMLAACTTVVVGAILASIGELIYVVDPERQKEQQRSEEAERALQVAQAADISRAAAERVKQWDDWKRNAQLAKHGAGRLGPL